MTIKGGLRKRYDASLNEEEVQFDGEVVGFDAQVAWQYNDTLIERKATCNNSPTKRCIR